MNTIALRYVFPLIAVAVVIAMVACKSDPQSQPKPESSPQPQPTEKRRPIRIGYSNWVGYYPLPLAKEKGFFAKQGVDVELVLKTDLYELLPDFAAGRIDGFVFAPDAPLRLLSKGSNVKIVLWTGDCLGCDSVVVQPRFQSVADLKGKKVGIHIGSFGEMFVDEMMRQNGLSIGDVQLINADERAVPDYLKKDTIQAGHTWEPYTSQALKDGGKILFSTKQTPGLFTDIMIFHATDLAERPDDLRALVRAWFETIAYWGKNVQEGNEIVGKTLNVSPAEVMDARGAYEYFSPDEAKRRLALGNDPKGLRAILDKHVDFMVRTGALGRRPDIDGLITTEFLPTTAAPQ